MIAQILTNSAAIKYNHYRRKNDRALNTEWSEKRKQANRPMNENYVDAEAGVIKSQKQPLLLTPWTNLSSVGYAFRCVVGPRRSSPHTTGQYGHQWWFSSLGPPPYSQATPSLYPPPVIVLVYSVICGFYWSSTTSSSSTYFPSTLFSSAFRLFLYYLDRTLTPLVACSI